MYYVIAYGPPGRGRIRQDTLVADYDDLASARGRAEYEQSVSPDGFVVTVEDDERREVRA